MLVPRKVAASVEWFDAVNTIGMRVFKVLPMLRFCTGSMVLTLPVLSQS